MSPLIFFAMLRTSHIISDIHEVPETWAYQFYCKLTESLTGQNVKLKSLLNSRDNDPSFFIFCRQGKYSWKDFSTGKGGNHITLISELFNLTRVEAMHKLTKDYSLFLQANPEGFKFEQINPQSRYMPTSIVTRTWNSQDAMFWTKFGIGSAILEKFNVKAIQSYVFATEDGSRDPIQKSAPYTYGYFMSDGTVAKIYQPLLPEIKFIKVTEYIQGTDQLQFAQPNLIICSSLKDAMSLTAFGYNTEVVAPDSENVVIKTDVMDIYKKKFRSICTLFDNDGAGLRAMNNYKAMYDIPMVHLNLEKDLSDSVKIHGLEKTREVLTPLLKEALKK